jgi:hypothetical protein
MKMFVRGSVDESDIRPVPPPLTRPPQGGSKQNDPLAHPSGSLHFYAEIWGFFASPNFDGVETTGRGWQPSPPQKAQIGAKGSKPRDSPQTSPVLGNPVKHGTFVILNRREVLAKNASGSYMKNLTSASRGSITTSLKGAQDRTGSRALFLLQNSTYAADSAFRQGSISTQRKRNVAVSP